MKRLFSRARLLALPAALALCAAGAVPCYASLGKTPSDFGGVTARQAKSLAATSTTSAASYTVSTSTLASGTTVREYVTTGGVVFAVSWSGPFLPDLRTLLGDSFTTLTTASASRPKAGNNRVHVDGTDVTIESGGHMRAYAGRAWINSLLPSGFDTDDIQ